MPYGEHALGLALGPIVFEFDIRAASAADWLPETTLWHHAVELWPDERREYSRLTRRVELCADQLRDEGIALGRAWTLASSGGSGADLARLYVGAVSRRKDLLYRARERKRAAVMILRDLAEQGFDYRALLFHERIDEAVALSEALTVTLAPIQVALDHSKLPPAARRRALDGFAAGEATVLVSVRSLIEGIDVPEADVGICVASSSSVRQRIQSLGRVLRRRFDGGIKYADMHLIYVKDTVDEAIYGKRDWPDLTGRVSNWYQHWALGEERLEALHGPSDSGMPLWLPGRVS